MVFCPFPGPQRRQPDNFPTVFFLEPNYEVDLFAFQAIITISTECISMKVANNLKLLKLV